MSLSVDDEFLTTIAHQARVVYATQQLALCRAALQRWQADGASETEARDAGAVQQELVHHAQQIERWQTYLRHLGAGPKALLASEAPTF
jgi:hypothetical protein